MSTNLNIRVSVAAGLVALAAACGYGAYRYGPALLSAKVVGEKAPASISVSDQGIILGRRGDQASAIVDLYEVAPTLSRVSEEDAENLVRKMLVAAARGWFKEDRFANVKAATVDVVTVVRRDEYQRPNFGSALRHGRMTIQNNAGQVGAVSGALDFKELRAIRAAFKPQQAKPTEVAGGNRIEDVRPVAEVTLKQLQDAKEEIVFDELDLWQHPRALSNVFPSFEPLRVRATDAEYFFRNDSATARFAASGHRYGEVRLLKSAGSVTYVPQHVDFSDTLGYSFKIRKSDPKARAVFRVYLNFGMAATFVEGESKYFPKIDNTDWTTIRIPFSAVKFTPVEHRVAEKPTWRDPNDFLSRYPGERGYVFAFELGLQNASPGDALYFDRFVVLRPDVGQKQGDIIGHLEQADPNVRVHVHGRGFDTVVTPDGAGNFNVSVPNGVPVVEIYGQRGQSLFSPASGRYLEMGSYVPEIVLPTTEQSGTRYPVTAAFNSAIYKHDTPIGAHIQPGHFGFARVRDGKVQFMLEQRANRFGFLDRDRRFDNPDHAYRVVLVGDSYFMGIFNDMRDSVWNQTEAMVNVASDRPFEFIAATHHHAPFINSWSQFENYALKFKPKVFILGLREPEILNFVNPEYVRAWLDNSVDHPPASTWHVGPDGKVTVTPPDPNWEQFLSPMTAQEKEKSREVIDARQFLRPDLENAPQWVRDAYKTIAAALTRFADEGRKNGVEVVLAFAEYPPDTAKLNGVRDIKFDPSLFRQRIEAIAKEAGVTFFDMTPDLYAGITDPAMMRVPGDGHWSSYAHYRAGKVFAAEMLRRLKASN